VGDKFDLVAENLLTVVAEKRKISEMAELFAVCVLVAVELPEGFVEFAKTVGVGSVLAEQVAAEESWVA
jgi:hypothetical protein